MTAALETVQDYVTTARALLQDVIVPYRYPDADLCVALGLALLDARKLRVDLFLGSEDTIPSFSTVDTTPVAMDNQYRTAILYYIVGHAQLRDEEDTQDARAAAFLGKFASQMKAN